MAEPASAPSNQFETAGPTPTTPVSPMRTTKRKIDEALHSLDAVLQQNDDMGPPAKKTRFRSSLYSTLAKYGIKTSKPQSNPKVDDLSRLQRTAPHLSAILARAATKRQKQKTETHAPTPLPSSIAAYSGATEYRPSSTVSFLSRLSSFKLATYSNKPAAIDAVACAKTGWVNDGKDRLTCGICRSSWVVASRDGMTRDAANSLLEKQRKALVDNHKERCPWKSQQCDASIYCVPLKPPSALTKDIKKHALELEESEILDGVEIRHPLTTAQVNALMSTLSSVQLHSSLDVLDVDEQLQPPNEPQPESEPSQSTALAALFGWTLPPPSPSSACSSSRPFTPSSSRAGSIAPTVPSVPSTPRRSSEAFTSEAPETPMTPRPSALRFSSTAPDGPHRRDSQKDRDSALLYCKLCQRKVGLWAFKTSPSSPTLPSTPSTSSISTMASGPSVPPTPSRAARRISQLPKRQLDLLKEHRSYCPYVARSTSLPSLPLYAPSTTSLITPPARPALPPRTNSLPTFPFSFSPRNAPTYPMQQQQHGLPLVDPIMLVIDPNTSAIEGWRAVLTVVLRTGFSRRQRMRSLNLNPSRTGGNTGQDGQEVQDGDPDAEDPDRMEVDGIHAMVESVKAHGPKDLLRYVKSLFA